MVEYCSVDTRLPDYKFKVDLEAYDTGERARIVFTSIEANMELDKGVSFC